jgi:hypothetical protein
MLGILVSPAVSVGPHQRRVSLVPKKDVRRLGQTGM